MTETPVQKPNPVLIALPVILFAALALLFWKGLFGDPQTVPSALIGKPAPEVTLPAIEGSGFPAFTSADLKGGGVSVVNVWASWCAPCREEHPLLLELAGRKDIHLYGINYKDDAENARRFLGTLGNPFSAIVADVNGRAAVDWGVYGVPETYVIDGQGIIRFKQIGPLSAEALAGPFAAEIDKAKTPLKQD
ncbi:DsbE family thiol:disulfide interchange protein [Aestuariivirga sp.]|uniref:DsbE family thiol:disulfide interchange protein n=1 Tax=Aestuariivirga sp. TaxID=2650926 RepID=UPI0039E4AA92